MSTNNSYLLANLLGQLLMESRITNVPIYPKFNSSTNINSRLMQYDLQIKCLALSDEQKLLHAGEYTPGDVAAWITRSSNITSWSVAK